MRILIINDGMQIGGIRSSLIAFLKALSARKIEVDVYLCMENPEGIEDLPQSIHIIDIPQFTKIVDSHYGLQRLVYMVQNGTILNALQQKIIARLPIISADQKKRLNMQLYQKRELRMCMSSKVLVDLDKYDLVVSWGELLPTYILANNINCKKKYAWIHPDYIEAGFDSEVDRESFRKMDGIVAVSEAGKDSLQKVFPELVGSIYSIQNLLDIDSIRRKAELFHPSYDERCLHFVTVARLQNISKAYDRALRIAKRLADMKYEFVWHFVGEGEDRTMIENYIRQNGLFDYVKMHGLQENPYPYMKMADLFILQSYYEGQPIVVNEAMVLGTPVLVTNYASAMQQVKNEQEGLIVENNEEDIFLGIQRILDHPSLLQVWKKNLVSKDFSYLTSIEPFLQMTDGK